MLPIESCWNLCISQIEASTSPPGVPQAFDVLSCPGGGNLINLVFPGQAFDHYSLGVGNLIASLDFMLRVALIPQGVIKSWRRRAFMHSKRKISDSWRTGWKAKACTSFVLYLKVFKNHLHYLWHVRVLSPDLLNHVYIDSFRSIIKATEKFPGGGGIWSPGPGCSKAD